MRKQIQRRYQVSKNKRARPLIFLRQYTCQPLERRVLLSAVDLDPTFGSGGKVVTDIGGGNDFASGVAIQSDGKFVVAGRTSVGAYTEFALVRYNTDGSLDSGQPGDLNPADHFGVDGKVVTDLSTVQGMGQIGEGSEANAMVLQPDGKIVVGGYEELFDPFNNKRFLAMAVVRYKTDGSLDTSFGAAGNGITATGFGAADAPIPSAINSLALQSDGKIVAAGHAGNDFALVRFTTGGLLDGNFAGGQVVTDFGGFDVANAVAIEGDGAIVAEGYTRPNPNSVASIALARYNSNGTLDSNFDVDGKVTMTIFGGVDGDGDPIDILGDSLALQRDGRIVVGAGEIHDVFSGSVLLRLNDNGSLDTTFDVIDETFGLSSYAIPSVALQRDGKIDMAVNSLEYPHAGPDTTVIQFGSGFLSSEFGDGTFDESIGGAIAVAPDGKIIIAGYTDEGGSGDNFGIARLQGDPTAGYASISGNVFTDIDGNGVKATGESLRTDARVYIDADNNGSYSATEQSCLTDLNGNYRLDGLDAGTYHVRVVVPNTYTQSAPSGNAAYTVTVTAGQNATGKTFGLKPPKGNFPLAQIGGTVFNDLLANGIRDVGDPLNPTEPGIAGCQVYLDLNLNGQYDSGEPSQTTDPDGDFLFGEFSSGTYRVRVVPPAATWLTTTPSSFDVSVTNGNEVDESFGLVQLIGGVAGATDDTIVVRRDPADSTLLEVLVNNQTTFDSPCSLLSAIVIDSGTGNDTIDLQDVPVGLPTQVIEHGNGAVNIGNAGNMQDILSNVTESNPAGMTSLNLDDSDDPTGRVVAISSTSVSGLAPAAIFYNQNFVPDGSGDPVLSGLSVATGSGADTVSVASLNDGAGGFSLSTGAGDDTVNLGAGPNRVSGFNSAVIFINGGAGTNALNIDDQAGFQSTTWTLSASAATDLGGPTISYSSFALLSLNASAHGSIFNVTSAATATSITLNEGAGNDTNTIGPNHTVRQIFSKVTINGSGGTNTLFVDDASATSRATVHVTPTQIGAVAGDNLFPAGGSVDYAGISSLTLSTPGASTGDTIYVRASATTAMTINGGNPTTSPGDSMTLADADATTPQLTPNGVGAGQYTFGNRMPVTFTGIEQPATDSIAPTVSAAGVTTQFNALPLSLSFGFSEPLSGAPPLSAFSASSQSALPVPFSTVGFTGNVATVSISGVLADGNYHGVLQASGVVDQPGNSMSSDYPFDFFSLTGDANHDRFVNSMDFTLLAQNFNAIGVGASQGDFNYDGKVNVLDFNILASKFGTHLAPASSAPPLAAQPTAPTSPNDLFGNRPISLDVRDLTDVI